MVTLLIIALSHQVSVSSWQCYSSAEISTVSLHDKGLKERLRRRIISLPAEFSVCYSVNL